MWQADGGRGQLQGALGQPARRHPAVGGGTLQQESLHFLNKKRFHIVHNHDRSVDGSTDDLVACSVCDVSVEEGDGSELRPDYGKCLRESWIVVHIFHT